LSLYRALFALSLYILCRMALSCYSCRFKVAHNDLGFMQPGPCRGFGLAKIGVPFPSSQFTPAHDQKQIVYSEGGPGCINPHVVRITTLNLIYLIRAGKSLRGGPPFLVITPTK
jgi:hypothetical protein